MPRKSALTPEQWAEARSLYETGSASFADIGARYGLSDVAVGKRAQKDGWNRARSMKQLATDAQIAADGVARGGFSSEVRTPPEVQEDAVVVRRKVIVQHREDGADLRADRRECLEDWRLVRRGYRLLRSGGPEPGDLPAPEFEKARKEHETRVKAAREDLFSAKTAAETAKLMHQTVQIGHEIDRKAHGLDAYMEPPPPPPSVPLPKFDYSKLRKRKEADARKYGHTLGRGDEPDELSA